MLSWHFWRTKLYKKIIYDTKEYIYANKSLIRTYALEKQKSFAELILIHYAQLQNICIVISKTNDDSLTIIQIQSASSLESQLCNLIDFTDLQM